MELRRSNRSEAISGGAMDRVVERKRLDRHIVIGGAAAAIIALVILFWIFAPRSDSVSVSRDRLAISAAQSGTFDDFLPLRGRVTPLVTVYLDAVEGGRVDKKLVEDGAQVTAGQPLAVLSNAELQLSTLEKQAEVEQQLNNMRSQELALTESHNNNLRDLNQAETDLAKARRQYDLYKPLANKGFVAMKTYNDAKDDMNYQANRLEILKRSVPQSEALQTSQLSQLRSAAGSLNSSMGIARATLANSIFARRSRANSAASTSSSASRSSRVSGSVRSTAPAATRSRRTSTNSILDVSGLDRVPRRISTARPTG